MFTCIASATRRGAFGSLLLLSLPAAAQAQELPLRFGKLDAKEAAELLARPAPDSAAAEVLCNFGQSKIQGAQEGFELRFERTARLLIRRRPGYEHATVRVVLYHDPKDGRREQILQLKGFTYNLAGKELTKEPLRTEAVFSRKLNERLDEYAFTLPNVREGSILEFTYVIRSPFLFNLQDWQFQQEIPVRWSEYRVQIPGFFVYKELSHTYWPFAINETGSAPYTTAYREKVEDSFGGHAGLQERSYSISTQAITRRWVQKDVPAFQEEPFLTTETDYLSRVDFELERIQFDPNREPSYVIGTWAQIEKQLLEHEEFGQYLKRDSPLADGAAALRTIPDPTARAVAARQLVLQAVGYSGTTSLYARNSPKKVLETRQGNAAEINLLLVRMLREAGLEAQPLLLSTRRHGRVQAELPVVSQFNYVAAHVALPGGKQLLLDATDATLPPELLPENCLNGQGRLLGPAGRWVSLAPATSHLRYTHARLTLDAKGGLQGTVRQEFAGYAAAENRQPLTELRQQWQKAHPDWQIDKAEATTSDLSRPVALSLNARLPGAEAPATTLYVRPVAQLGVPANPFQHPDRLYPVDLPTERRLEYMVELTLPEGYAATELPAGTTLNLPNNGGRFIFNVGQPTARTLTVTGRLHLTKTRYSAEEYQALRELYTRALAKLAEPIVLHRH
ncbi:transglutaminase-like putative cysteine protease [Hymenobacter luteus]|uniref:Transglutaminase-like putative cysteine protease n=2 Tax=Hymenobacter TaxID=89966 RepID=A0A7W9WC86_9BACT|nr:MULTISPECIES: DUF3857 domain-containing protein [Hymenobacter]MBB4600568.1 transglutaminase-like putative cysteine protease [Hymenobacter latericoloratus]MBB6059225.1 transglutaminase-like putative cysteine protease [Hymenobacter luteus]